MLVIIMVLFLLLMYGLYEYRNIQKINLSYKDFEMNDTFGFKIVFLSDIQYDWRGHTFQHKLMKKLVTKVNDENPDLVIFGGDYIHHQGQNNPVFKYLKQISAEKVGILGNHDYKDLAFVKRGCLDAGIRLLVNETYEFRGIEIIGLDDLREGKPKMPKLGNKRKILLIHEPDDFENYFEVCDFDMVFAGHLHAGQVTVFGKYAPIVPSLYKKRYLHGLVKCGNNTIYVSSGLGGFVFFVPLRFFAPPEIVVVD